MDFKSFAAKAASATSASFSNAGAIIGSAFNTAVDNTCSFSVAAYDWACDAGKAAGKVAVVSALAAAQLAAEFVKLFIDIALWVLFMPFRVLSTVVAWVFLMVCFSAVEEQMRKTSSDWETAKAEVEEEERFARAAAVN